jgi:hypothetical protein
MLTFAPTVWAAFVSQVKGRQTGYGMIGYSRWRDIRVECIARAGGVEAVETGKQNLLALRVPTRSGLLLHVLGDVDDRAVRVADEKPA